MASPPPVCDAACQKQKQLNGLYTAMVQAEGNPEAYEKARIAYYTLKDGQDWLVDEKERIAKQEVVPVLQRYTARFDQLKDQLQQTSHLADLTSYLKSQEVGDEEEARFLTRQIRSERDKAGASARATQLESSNTTWYTWLPYILDVLIALASVFIFYQFFVAGKLQKILGYFRPSPSPEPSIL